MQCNNAKKCGVKEPFFDHRKTRVDGWHVYQDKEARMPKVESILLQWEINVCLNKSECKTLRLKCTLIDL